MGNLWNLKDFEQELDYNFTREDLYSVYPPFLESLKELVAYEHWPRLNEFIDSVKRYDFEKDGYDDLYLELSGFTLELIGEIGKLILKSETKILGFEALAGYPPLRWRGVDYSLVQVI